MIKIEQGSNEQVQRLVEWSLECWRNGLAMNGMAVDYTTEVLPAELLTKSKLDVGKLALVVDLAVRIPVNSTTDAVSSHKVGLPLYEVWQSDDPGTALCMAVASFINVLNKEVHTKLVQVESGEYN
jgi:hypothetical protein